MDLLTSVFESLWFRLGGPFVLIVVLLVVIWWLSEKYGGHDPGRW